LFAPEADLLICAGQIFSRLEASTKLESLLSSALNWDELIDLADYEGMIPILFHEISGRSELVPAQAFVRLKQEFEKNARKNLFLSSQLIKLAHLFESNGIPVVPFKGPILASTFYGDLGLRQFTDLDIWIDRENVTKAERILKENGYRPKMEIQGVWRDKFLRTQCELIFFGSRGDVVEIHWDFMPYYFPFPMDLNAVRLRLNEMNLGGTKVQSLSTEDLLLFLSAHGAKHRWRHLLWICDIAKVQHRIQDWNYVWDSAEKTGSQRMVLLALYLAAELLRVELPQTIQVMIKKDPKMKPLAEKVYELLFVNPGPGAKGRMFWPFYYQVRERISDRVKCCARTFIHPTIDDWAWISLPESMYILYYFLRPIRLSGKYLRQAL